MLRRRGNDRGLAEIVGTLMLVLIVVSAAVAFAAFVASYQAQLQASEAATHLQALEALHVLSVDATPGGLSVAATSGTIQTPTLGTGVAETVGFYALFPGTTAFIPSSFRITAFACSAAPGTCTPAGTPYTPSSSVYAAGDWNVSFTASVLATSGDSIGFTSATLSHNSYVAQMNVTIASGDVNPMWVEDFSVDGSAVISYNATYLESGTTVRVGIFPQTAPNDTNSTLFLPALQQVVITLELNNSAYPLFSFLPGEPFPTTNTALILDFFTSRGNSFTAVYLPPIALADVTYAQTSIMGTPTYYPVLDGTGSFQQGTNATLIGWNWVVTNETSDTQFNAPGAEVDLTNITSLLDSLDHYEAVLTVTNSVGLVAVSLPVSFQG